MQLRIVAANGSQPLPPPSPPSPSPPPSPTPTPSPSPQPTDLYRCVNNTCVHVDSVGTGIDLLTCKKICGPGFMRLKTDDCGSAAAVQNLTIQLQRIQMVLKLLGSLLALVAAAVAFHWCRPKYSRKSKSAASEAVQPIRSAPFFAQPIRSAPLISSSNFLDVTAFGAVGDDATDCTVAIQNALDAMKDGDVLFFPAGKYKTTSTVDVGGRGGTKLSAAGGHADPPKLKSGLTVCGTRNSVIHHNPGSAGEGYGHRVFDVHGPYCVIRDLLFWNREDYPHTGAGANINVQMSAQFTELAGLRFDVTGQNPMVVCCRGANIHDCIVMSSPEHGVYLSGAAYGLQQPTDTRITNNHFENIAKNGIQVCFSRNLHVDTTCMYAIRSPD